jgi:dihydrofolate reductase
MFNWLTANGCFAGPDGNLDWVVADDEQARAAAEAMPSFDAVLFGRRTYQLFEGFWRHAVDDAATAPDPHRAGERSRDHGVIGTWLNGVTKLVFSRTLKEATWGDSRILHDLDPREIEHIKRQPGGDMMIFGSASIVSQLTEHGLIDEYQLVVCPVLLPSGRPLLGGGAKRSRLTLLEARQYPSGDVLLRYARAT